MAKKASGKGKTGAAKPKPKAKGGKKSRSLNDGAGTVAQGAPANEHDPKRRLGNYGSAGEHPRQGGRTSGIVGMSTRKNHTDKKS